MGHEHLCTCLVRQGASGASAVHHWETGKCAKTEIYDLSILIKDNGVLGFWGSVRGVRARSLQGSKEFS